MYVYFSSALFLRKNGFLMIVGEPCGWISSMVAAEFGVGRADGIEVGGGTVVDVEFCM